MSSFGRYIWLAVIALIFPYSAKTEENCEISIAELSKIEQTLTHIKEPIYAEGTESQVSDSNACAEMLRGIHLQLRRLTQRYKLMNKGYVQAEEFKKMAKEYEDQLSQLNGELEKFKVGAESSAKEKLKELRKDIEKLEQDVSSLHEDLKGITDELGKVTKDLCLTYVESNQLNNAIDKVKELNSKYLLELVEEFLNKSEGNWLPIVDLSVEVPDLDDRGEVYKTIYKFLQTKKRMEGEDALVLEAEILKMSATFHNGSKITDVRKKELQDLLEKLSSISDNIFKKWTLELSKSENYTMFKNAIDRLFLTQMEKFGEHITARFDFFSVKNALRLLAVSTNYYKIAAYRKLIDKRKTPTFAVIMIDMISMERTELRYDKHVPDEIERMYNNTLDMLPKNLKDIISCQTSVKIRNQDTDQCIFAKEEKVMVQHPTSTIITLGHFKPVIATHESCTTFRLELSPDKTSIRIITAGGYPLTNINSPVPGLTYFGRVGAPYTNNAGKSLDYSQDWILDAKFGGIKIETEFSAYQTKKNLDHLVVKDVDGVSQVVVARYGLPGMIKAGINDTRTYWKLECAN